MKEKKILSPLSILIVQIVNPLSFSNLRLGCCGFFANIDIVLIVLLRSFTLFLKNFYSYHT